MKDPSLDDRVKTILADTILADTAFTSRVQKAMGDILAGSLGTSGARGEGKEKVGRRKRRKSSDTGEPKKKTRLTGGSSSSRRASVSDRGRSNREVKPPAGKRRSNSSASNPSDNAGSKAGGGDRPWWADIAADPNAPPVMKEVLQMTGLATVKCKMAEQYHRIKLAREQRRAGASSYNVRSEGNPGTGKTAVARHYGKFLRQIKVLPSGAVFKEVSGADLCHGDGVTQLKGVLREVKAARGGVVFVDEACQLASDRQGKRVLDFILPLSESLSSSYGPLVWIFAGYSKDMELLSQHNPGLPSRFPLQFTFEDYTDEELLEIFDGLREAPKNAAGRERGRRLKVTSKQSLKMAIRRLGRRRGLPGFGNARAVHVLFQQVLERQGARIVQERMRGADPCIFELTPSDLLGPGASAARVRDCAAYKELQAMEGLQPVKEQVEQLITLAETNARRERKDKPLLGVSLNRIFLGNPGTGKTTVARLYGRILQEMGLLSKGDVLLKNPSDFVGDVVGSSQKRTREILKASEGCVLVIDEAYSLYSGSGLGSSRNDSYKAAVIDTLVEQVQAVPGDDRAVLLLGYEEDMRRMLQHVNPGLSRRFQLEHAFNFPDYDDAALVSILKAKVEAKGLMISEEVATHAVGALAPARARPHFGNAGAVDNLLPEAILRMQKRGGGTRSWLKRKDFDVRERKHDSVVLASLFGDMVGCDSVRQKLQSLLDMVQLAQGLGEDVSSGVGFNYLFLGNPGTGKTTVARRMGAMFKSLGLLPDDTVKEVSASDLVTGFLGQTGKQTRQVLLQARGGVLFIDEAYQLNPDRGGRYMAEAVDELVKNLTSEEFKGKVLVILAGYHADMEQMLSANPGLRSRFADRLHFEDLTAPAVSELLVSSLKKRLPVAQRAKGGLAELAARLVCLPDFGNGRDVETWSQLTFQKVASRSKHEPENAKVTLKDLRAALEDMLDDRAGPAKAGKAAWRQPGSRSPAGEPRQPEQAADEAPARQPVKMNRARATAATSAAAAHASSDEAPQGGPDVAPPESSLFDDVDSPVLAKIQQVLDGMGMNTEDGIARLADADPRGGGQFRRWMASKLVGGLGMDTASARAQLIKWQAGHKELRAKKDQLKQEAASGEMTRRAIWSCKICGRANKPHIACHVAPYIVRYESIPK